ARPAARRVIIFGCLSTDYSPCVVSTESHSHSTAVDQPPDAGKHVVGVAAPARSPDASSVAANGGGQADVRSVAAAERVRPYVPRTVQQHLVDDPDGRCWTDDGTAVFVDISGFTQLSEQLAR